MNTRSRISALDLFSRLLTLAVFAITVLATNLSCVAQTSSGRADDSCGIRAYALRCEGFDLPPAQNDASSSVPGVSPVNSNGLKVYRARLDSNVKAEGAGSLLFDVPESAGPNGAGDFHMNFSDSPFAIQFGEGSSQGSEFYIQWRQRFDSPTLKNRVRGGGGFKQVIVGFGDSMQSSRPVIQPSCSDGEIVVQPYYQLNLPRVYHGCGSKDDTYEPIFPVAKSGVYLLQDSLGCYSQQLGNCFMFQPDQWMTFQLHVKLGKDYRNDRNYHHDSTIELWGAPEGKPSELISSVTDYDIVQHQILRDGASVPRQFGKIWLLPYETDRCLADFSISSIERDGRTATATLNQATYCIKVGDQILIQAGNDLANGGPFTVTAVSKNTVSYNDSRQATKVSGGNLRDKNLEAPGKFWYDGLIISKRRVPDPDVKTPNPPDDLVVSVRQGDNQLTWRDNSDVGGSGPAAGFVIERCAGDRYRDCLVNPSNFKQVARVPLTTSWMDRSGSGSLYTYRVRAFNNQGSSAWSNVATNLPGIASDVTAQVVGSNQVRIAWKQSPPSNQIGYEIERCSGPVSQCGNPDGKGLYQVISNRIPANQTEFIDPGVSLGQVYCYRVKAVGSAGAYRDWGSKYYPGTSYGGGTAASEVTVK